MSALEGHARYFEQPGNRSRVERVGIESSRINGTEPFYLFLVSLIRFLSLCQVLLVCPDNALGGVSKNVSLNHKSDGKFLETVSLGIKLVLFGFIVPGFSPCLFLSSPA